MRNTWKVLILCLALLGISSCRDTAGLVPQAEQETETAVTPMGTGLKGRLVVKIKPEAVPLFESYEADSTRVGLRSGAEPSTLALKDIQVRRVYRLFPSSDQTAEKTTREAGLHRWYVVEFDKDKHIASAYSTLVILDQIETVELVREVVKTEVGGAESSFLRNGLLKFNDPELPNQWNLNNPGKEKNGIPGCVQGADINLFKAWEITTGNPNVIVCVVDEDVDTTHPDLVNNLWTNPKETENNADDEDTNDLVDDVHGYSFFAGKGKPTPGPASHGTHIAGIIAAENGNNKGICGIAGGNGTPGTGVKIMYAGIMGGYRGLTPGSEIAANAIKYGADMGAVISQNSWSLPDGDGNVMPEHIKEAIDYFIENAGRGVNDKNKNLRPNSPMAGGIVIFAAGNENTEAVLYPQAYEKVIAVAAMGPGFKRASYSNYGTWVDITAPGGDKDTYHDERAGILSTVCKTSEDVKGKEYAYMNGTSMACPHVSGVAALILSRVVEQGIKDYTADMLREQLLSAVLPLDIDRMNPGYEGKLGAGYLDAYAALTRKKSTENKGPETPDPKMKDSDISSITIGWTVPEDKEDGSAYYYKLYMSDKPLSEANYAQEGKPLGTNGIIKGLEHTKGQEMQYVVTGLTPATTYYFAMVAFDYWGAPSGVAFSKFETKTNHAPEITDFPTSEIVVADIQGTFTQEFEAKDLENHDWEVSVPSPIDGITLKKAKNKLRLRVQPIEAGLHVLSFILKDTYGAHKEYSFKIRTVQVSEPSVIIPIEDRIIGLANTPKTIDLSKVFDPQSKDLPLKYSAKTSGPKVLQVTCDPNSGKLELKALSLGDAVVTVVADNGYKSKTLRFTVSVPEDADKDIYSTWPLPLRNKLNIWANPRNKVVRVILIDRNGGKAIDEETSLDAKGIAKLNTSHIAPGNYTLQIEAGSSKYQKSILKR